MGDFGDELASLCRREFMAAKGDHERVASMLERLMHSAGFTIAMATGGDTKSMSTFLIGAEALLNEYAAEQADMARFLAKVTKP